MTQGSQPVRAGQGPAVVAAEDVPGPGPDPDGGAAAGGGDAVPVPQPERVLGVPRAGHRDAELVGLGAGPERRVGDDGDRPGGGPAAVPSLRAAPGGRHEAEPGQAHPGASDRGERGIEQGARNDAPGEGEANRLQGRASIGLLVWAAGYESSGMGYAPLESRTKRWADVEPLIEGWFPPPSGERHGCDRLPGCDAESEQRISHPPLSNRSGVSRDADAGGQDLIRRRVGSVRLDRQPVEATPRCRAPRLRGHRRLAAGCGSDGTEPNVRPAPSGLRGEQGRRGPPGVARCAARWRRSPGPAPDALDAGRVL